MKSHASNIKYLLILTQICSGRFKCLKFSNLICLVRKVSKQYKQNHNSKPVVRWPVPHSLLTSAANPRISKLLTTGTGYPINLEFSYINQGQACPRRSGDKPYGIKRAGRHYPKQLGPSRTLSHYYTGCTTLTNLDLTPHNFLYSTFHKLKLDSEDCG